MSTAKIYGYDLGLIRPSDLLSELWWQTSFHSGGIPTLGAVPQDDGSESLVWSSIAAEFLADEDGNLLVDEDGNYLVG
jgi:hypothetical protein